jgi:hypothetical protein
MSTKHFKIKALAKRLYRTPNPGLLQVWLGSQSMQPGPSAWLTSVQARLFVVPVLARAEFGGLPTHARGPRWQRLVQGDDLPVLMPSYAVPLLPTTKASPECALYTCKGPEVHDPKS